jgi:hypothetical protein
MFQRFERTLAVPTSRRSRSLWLDYVKIFLLILACVSVPARADLLYGVSSLGGITRGGSEFPGQNWSVGQSLPLTVTSYTSPVLSASGSCALCGGTVSGSATAWASSNGGSLHGYATTAQSGICENCVGGTPGGGGSFYIQWVDTIYVTGLPNGTPVDLMLTDALHSSSNSSGFGAFTELESGLALGSQDIQLLNNQGAADGLITQSVIVETVSGATLQLAATLTGGAGASDDPGGAPSSATVDASDTANSYITVLTPGASFTTASGIDYSAPATVPEPNNLWLIVAAFGGIVAVTCRRLKAPDKKPARD